LTSFDGFAFVVLFNITGRVIYQMKEQKISYLLVVIAFLKYSFYST
jgi:hypothetical protein